MRHWIQKCNDKAEWDVFVSESPHYNLFCTTQFLDVCGKDYDLVVIKDDKSILLGAVIIRDVDGCPINRPFVYQGVLLSRVVADYPNHKRAKKACDLVHELLGWLEVRSDRISFSLHHTFEDLRGFQWFHYHEPERGLFQADIRYSAVLALKNIGGIEGVLARARTVRRQEYKRCLREGFLVEETEDAGLLDRLHVMTFERQGLKRSTREAFIATTLAKTAVDQGFGRVIVCRSPDGNPISAGLFLFDRKTAYYLIGANNPAYRNSGSSTAVIFEQIRRCIEQGNTYIDFLGANSPNRGDFKTSFNAHLVQYVNVSWRGE